MSFEHTVKVVCTGDYCGDAEQECPYLDDEEGVCLLFAGIDEMRAWAFYDPKEDAFKRCDACQGAETGWESDEI